MDRKALKDHAKRVLKESSVIEMWGVAFVLNLVGGNYQPLFDILERGLLFIRRRRFDGGLLSRLIRAIQYDFPVFAILAALIIGTLGLLFTIFVVNNLRIGSKFFYIKCAKGEGVVFDRLFKNFREKTWKDQGLKMLRVDLEIILFMFLLIVPGIIKSYQYYWVPYLLAEDPSLSATHAIEMSKEMTTGKKMDLFITELSFIGWYILAGILFPFVTVPIVDAYRETTFATYYAMQGSGTPRNNFFHIESI